MTHAIFEGGPYNGCEMMIAARTLPAYLMLIDSPPGVAIYPMVVGADFDDHWPGQQRYDLTSEGTGDAIYTYSGDAGSSGSMQEP